MPSSGEYLVFRVDYPEGDTSGSTSDYFSLELSSIEGFEGLVGEEDIMEAATEMMANYGGLPEGATITLLI